MKTAEQKAKEFTDRIPLNMAIHRGQVEEAIRILIKEQDRDTRHACAEATIKLSLTVSQCPTVEYCKGFNAAIVQGHDACMNVSAV